MEPADEGGWWVRFVIRERGWNRRAAEDAEAELGSFRRRESHEWHEWGRMKSAHFARGAQVEQEMHKKQLPGGSRGGPSVEDVKHEDMKHEEALRAVGSFGKSAE